MNASNTHSGVPSALELAREQFRNGHRQAATQLCRRLIEHPASAGGAQHLLGLMAFSDGAHDQALTHLAAALALEPARADWHYDLAVIHGALAERDAAMASYRQAIALDPAQVDAHNNLGALLLDDQQPAEAVDCFVHALAIAPAHPAAMLNLGSALLALGRVDEAVARLHDATTLAADNPVAHFNLGNALRAAGYLNEAADSYRQSLALDPGHARSHYALAEIHHEQGQWQAAEDGYRRAIALTPALVEAHANLGVLLREQSRLDEAVQSLSQALQIAPGNRYLERQLRLAEHRSLPAWHFPMLGDHVRNDAYRRAIEQVVRSDSQVLDIGTGSGLLAMIAARAGAASVVACEVSPAIAATAQQIVADNGLADRIQVIAKRSTALLPGTDLPEPVNVIVSEIVDVGLLGEGVLPSMRHALRNLATPDAVSIPRAARVFAQLVELPALRASHPIGKVCGFDLGAFNRFQAIDEYLDINLATQPHQFLTEEADVLDVAFNAPPQHIPDAEPAVATMTFEVTGTGTVHAVAFWFELELAPGIVISNRPGTELVAWGQAVQFLPADVPVRAGQRLDVQLLRSDNRIAFEVAAPARATPTP